MPIGNNILAGASGQATGYDIENSLRFNSADDAKLTRTMASAGNRKTFTISFWVKKNIDTTEHGAIANVYHSGNDSDYFSIEFIKSGTNEDKLRVSGWNNSFRITDRVFRDPSAWYHIVVACDSTQSTANDRIKVYVNGSQETDFTNNYSPSQNADFGWNMAHVHFIGEEHSSSNFLDGYLAEFYSIDGQALTPASFGETNSATNQWQAIEYDGSYGTNGFYLPFSATELANSFTDSAEGHVVTANGNVHTDTSVKKIGTASAQFDGTGDYLSIPDSTDWDFGTGALTVECWVNFSSKTNAGFVSKLNGTGGAKSWSLYWNLSNTKLYWYGNSGANDISATWNPNTDQWYHVAVVRSSDTTTLYIDGTSIGSGTTSWTNDAGSSDLLIGREDNVGSVNDFNGYMDEIRISNTARYTGNFTPSTTAFTNDANTMLLLHCDGSDSGTTFTDSSTRPRHTITANGDVVHTRAQKKIGTSSIKFDGTGDYLSVPASSDWEIAASNSDSFTVEAWVKLDLHDGQETFVSQAASGSTLWRFRNHHGSSVSFQVYDSGSLIVDVSGAEIADTDWHHVALVKQGNSGDGGTDSKYILYKDGVQIGTSTDSSTLTVNGALEVGNAGAGGDPLEGYMDEIRISDIARYPAFVPTENITADFLVIGGGGGGGSNDRSGGGGAGGYRTSVGTSGGGASAESSLSLVANETYAVSVGVGGGSNAGGAPSYIVGPSVDITSKGGGRGARAEVSNGQTGGSGGGGGIGSTTPGSGTANQGYAGGTGASNTTNNESGGGGGGAGAVGGNGGNDSNGGDGGAGVSSSITGSAVTRAGGGGGGAWAFNGGSGGSGGGGAGGKQGLAGANGTANTGGGGGGGGQGGAGSGGSGIVIIRYVGTSPKATGGTITSYTDGGTTYQVHTFTTSTGFTPQTTEFTSDSNTKLLIHSDFNGGLGADNSGSENDFSATNLVATDQMLDSPTNNFATLNPIYEDGSAHTMNPIFAEGNLSITATDGNFHVAYSTITIPASGKWYLETYLEDGDIDGVGIVTASGRESVTNGWGMGAVTTAQGFATQANYVNNSSSNNFTLGTGTPSNGDICQLAIDADNNKVWIGLNNSWNDASGGTTGNPSSGTNHTIALTFGSDAQIGLQKTNASPNTGMVANFGQDSSFAGNKTAQGNTDGNGIGDFYYTPPTGYLALCSDNLPDSSISDPTKHFNTVLYTGNASTRSITGVGFQPDFIWGKQRNGTNAHVLVNSVTGNTKYLSSQRDNAEDTQTDVVTSFDSDGFSLGASVGFDMNHSGSNLVAWNWKAGGTASSNEDGSITSSVSANTDAGFSIVSYTGTTSNATVGHGLSQAPELVIVKPRSYADNWRVGSDELTSWVYHMRLNTTVAETSYAAIWNSTAPTSSVFNVGTDGTNGVSGATYIAYCFHGVDGYSKVGSYAGNSSSSDGTFVYTGFKPAYVLTKMIEPHNYEWVVSDSARDPYNAAGYQLYPNSNSAEAANHPRLDFVSNGFKWRDASYNVNHSSATYFYLAFASTPFKTSNGV